MGGIAVDEEEAENCLGNDLRKGGHPPGFKDNDHEFANLSAPFISGRGDLHELPLLELAVELVGHELLDVGHLHLVGARPRQRLPQLPLRHLQPELRLQVLLLDLLLLQRSGADLRKK